VIASDIYEKTGTCEGQGELVGDLVLLLIPGIGEAKAATRVGEVASTAAKLTEDIGSLANKAKILSEAEKVAGAVKIAETVVVHPPATALEAIATPATKLAETGVTKNLS